MRYATIMAGGSGTRLWPMSRRDMPKQLIPFLDGRSLLQQAWERIEGLIPDDRIYVCAAEDHRESIRGSLPSLEDKRYIGEPVGRDTLSAAGLSAAVIGRHDPDAIIAVLTADHVIGPVGAFQGYLDRGFQAVETGENVLATFGVTPTAAATGFGYLELGETEEPGLCAVRRFREKPAAEIARDYFCAGPERYLWNSGMFVWNAATLLDCIGRYEPDTHAGLTRIAEAWDTPARTDVLAEVYPSLHKISVDFAVMERAAQDPTVRVVAVPMSLEWMDVGSWASFAQTCPADADGNRQHAQNALTLDCRDTLLASSDPSHLIAAVGCEGLLIVHTPEATLVCPANRAEAVKELHARVAERFGTDRL